MTLLPLALAVLLQAPAQDGTTEFSNKILVAVRPSPQVMAEPSPESPSGWRFQRIVEAQPVALSGTAVGEPESPQLWVVASPPPVPFLEATARRPASDGWDLAHAIIDGTAPPPFNDLLAAVTEAVGAPVEIEPDVVYVAHRLARGHQRLQRQAGQAKCAPGATQHTLCNGPSFHWPAGKTFAWHLDDASSQLRKAREIVYGNPPQPPPLEKRVLIAHLDTGYDPNRTLKPEGFDQARSLDFTKVDPATGKTPMPGEAEDPGTGSFPLFPGHGTSTLSILAGGKVDLLQPPFQEFLGGAPFARVVCYRISGSVIHLHPRNMAHAIDLAVQEEVDVISLSMGGLPSRPLLKAVNNAYNEGTAIFAASGDFFKVPVLPLSSPRSTVYPARFDRVVSVSGVTYKNRTYARAPSLRTLLRGKWASWMLRGSYGPTVPMQDKALAAYAPNITRARYSRTPATLLDVDFSGTSAATPQAAAAAALWLQKNRDQLIREGSWRSWKKVEAVYQALFRSAKKDFPSTRHMRKYFGQGILKAGEALSVPVLPNLQRRPEARIGFEWLHLMGSVVTLPAGKGEDKANLHNVMMQTEIAQLTATSSRLQRILGDRDPAELENDRRRLVRFLRAVRKDPRTSGFLRRQIERNEAEGFGVLR